MTTSRPAVETLLGVAPQATRGIEEDFAMLAAVRETVAVRTWTCPGLAVVLGVSRDPAVEVDRDECARRGAAVLRRASGGGTVVVGAGTLQYAFAIPHGAESPPPSIDDVKRSCNARVAAALAAAGVRGPLEHDVSGDLVLRGRKVGGVALRRHRHATLLHGTLLVQADLDAVAAVLRHPAKEPAWRRGRGHLDFVANLGALDEQAFAKALQLLASDSGTGTSTPGP